MLRSAGLNNCENCSLNLTCPHWHIVVNFFPLSLGTIKIIQFAEQESWWNKQRTEPLDDWQHFEYINIANSGKKGSCVLMYYQPFVTKELTITLKLEPEVLGRQDIPHIHLCR